MTSLRTNQGALTICLKNEFVRRVNNRGELKLPCGRPLLIGRGEESVLSTHRKERDAAFEQGTGINFLIPPSSVWCCRWPCVATWLMEVGGVSDAGTNGGGRGQTRRAEPTNGMGVGSEH
ncbi:hypothetical protein TNCV_3053821 [Trichonephila clavipes]|uniref:Uncharacterized protein n=1 Tax=Trichonephila clavipes TaxID=2585209 RepID=A0A8X6RSG5_TRICX|nr:hypothetical protein TNCV_3053821 [Trichonephila clavipes]